MPKIPTLSLPRPTPKTLTRTFTDPDRPDLPIVMTLRDLAENPHAMLCAGDRATEFAAQYAVNWYPHAGSGTAVQITTTIAQQVCILEAMQVGSRDEVYTREECLGIMISLPGAWKAILAAVEELTAAPEVGPTAAEVEANGHDPNSTGVPASTSCGPPGIAVSVTPT